MRPEPDPKKPEWIQAALSVIVLMSSFVTFGVSLYTTRVVVEMKLYVMEEAKRAAERNEAVYTRREMLESLEKRVSVLESNR